VPPLLPSMAVVVGWGTCTSSNIVNREKVERNQDNR
jgi:hypothetical protein